LGLAFFGLTPDYKKIVLDEVFFLCYHSQGGFTHDEAYNMPIRYRRYYLQKIVEINEKQNEMMTQRHNNNSSTTVTEPNKKSKDPVLIPDFVAKASKRQAPKR